jgi:hypothetical protein
MNNTICDTDLNYKIDMVCDAIDDWYSPKSKTLKNDFKSSIKKYHKTDTYKPIYKMFVLCVNLLAERESMISHNPSKEGKLNKFEADISVMFERYRNSNGEKLDDVHSFMKNKLEDDCEEIDSILYELNEQFNKTKSSIGVEVDDPYRDTSLKEPKKEVIYSPQGYKRVLSAWKDSLKQMEQDKDAYGTTWFRNHIKWLEENKELDKFRPK